MLLVEWGVAGGLLRLARHLELQLRVKFLRKIPKLGDRYFQSRPKSDMAERSHSTHQLRQLPWLIGQLARSVLTLLVTAGAICWLDPPSSALAIAAAIAAVGIPLLFRPRLQERDLRVRTHTGALSRFYLDALLGLTAVQAHNAQRAIRREHEGLLVEWARASYRMIATVLKLEGFQSVIGYGLAVAILLTHAQRMADPALAVLLAYWALQLPMLGDEVAMYVSQYPLYRNLTLRLLEPLGAPEEFLPPDSRPASEEPPLDRSGVAISIRNVAVRAAGQTILAESTSTLNLASTSPSSVPQAPASPAWSDCCWDGIGRLPVTC